MLSCLSIPPRGMLRAVAFLPFCLFRWDAKPSPTGCEVGGEIDGEIGGEIDRVVDGEVDGEVDGDVDGEVDREVDPEVDGVVDGEVAGEVAGDGLLFFLFTAGCLFIVIVYVRKHPTPSGCLGRGLR